MIYSLLQVGALVATLEAAFFLARGSLVMSAQRIAQLCRTTHEGYNARLVQSLAQQTADSRIGVVLLLASFSLQMAAQLRGPVISDISPADPTAIGIAITVGLVVFGVSCVSSRICASTIAREATEILKAGAVTHGAF